MARHSLLYKIQHGLVDIESPENQNVATGISLLLRKLRPIFFIVLCRIDLKFSI